MYDKEEAFNGPPITKEKNVSCEFPFPGWAAAAAAAPPGSTSWTTESICLVISQMVCVQQHVVSFAVVCKNI